MGEAVEVVPGQLLPPLARAAVVEAVVAALAGALRSVLAPTLVLASASVWR